MTKISLTDKAYNRIKKWIIGFHLKPDTHLTIERLAKTLGISQTPVREALSRLEQEYLVVRTPMKGFMVKGTSRKEIEDLTEVRTVVELLAVKQAAKRIDRSSRKPITDNLKLMERALKKKEMPLGLKLVQDIHERILEASGNMPLIEVGRSILSRTWALQNINLISIETLNEAHQAHLKIFESISEGNSREAVSLMRKHMKHAKNVLKSRLKDENDFIHKAISFDANKWSKLKN